MKKNYLVFVALFIFLAGSAAASAPTGSMEENIFVTKGQEIQSNYWRLAKALDISGVMKKDVVALADTVVVDGVIEGDLIGAANSLTINGEVRGNVRFIAQTIKINGPVGKNLTALSSRLEVGAPIGWGIVGYTRDFILNGEQSGEVNVSAETAEINKNVLGNLILNVTQSGAITFSPQVKVSGDFEYSPVEAPILNLDSLQVGGETKKLAIREGWSGNNHWNWLYVYRQALYLLSLLFIAYFGQIFVRGRLSDVAGVINRDPLAVFNRGFWWLLLAPVACAVLALTIIGLPLGVILACLYIIVFYLSKVLVGLALGAWILRKDLKKDKLVLPLGLGILVVAVLVSLPMVGFLFNLIISTLGFGGLALTLRGALGKGER